MEAENLRVELLAIRAQVDRLLDRLPGAEPARPEEHEPEPKWMKPSRYAKSRDFSIRTLHTMIAEGLPVRGEGARRRIDVVKADEWLKRRKRKSG